MGKGAHGGGHHGGGGGGGGHHGGGGGGGGGGHHGGGGGGGHHGGGGSRGPHLAATQAAMHHGGGQFHVGHGHGYHGGHRPREHYVYNGGPPPPPETYGGGGGGGGGRGDGDRDCLTILLFFVTVLLLILIAKDVTEYRENHVYEAPVEHCEVVDSVLDDWWEHDGDEHHFEGIVTVSFRVVGMPSNVVTATKASAHSSLCKGPYGIKPPFPDGTSYGCAAGFLNRFPIGSLVPCWYDPSSPYDRVILARNNSSIFRWIFTVIFVIYFVTVFSMCCFDKGPFNPRNRPGFNRSPAPEPSLLAEVGVSGTYGSVSTTEPIVLDVMPQPSAPAMPPVHPPVAPVEVAPVHVPHPLPHVTPAATSAANPF